MLCEISTFVANNSWAYTFWWVALLGLIGKPKSALSTNIKGALLMLHTCGKC